jgi:hypothetical protein
MSHQFLWSPFKYNNQELNYWKKNRLHPNRKQEARVEPKTIHVRRRRSPPDLLFSAEVWETDRFWFFTQLKRQLLLGPCSKTTSYPIGAIQSVSTMTWDDTIDYILSFCVFYFVHLGALHLVNQLSH